MSIFQVNCSERYYSKILCEKNEGSTIEKEWMQEGNESRYKENKSLCNEREPTNLTGMEKDCKSARAFGRYYIVNSTLWQRHHICPTGYNIFIDGKCIKLVPNHTSVMKYDVVNMSKSICKNGGIPHEATFDKNTGLSPVYAILEEYYAEGADIITSKKADKADLYFWLPPELYPTYFPCFTRREATQETQSRTSGVMLYKCADGSVIPNALVCNGKGDCRNAEDEAHCSVCSKFLSGICFNNCFFPTCVCNMFYYQCEGGGCVHYDLVCDTFVDCPGGDDESLCNSKKFALSFDKHFIQESYMAGVCDPLSYDLLMCRSKPQCYNSSAICHYDHSGGMMTFCEDGSHLANVSLCQYIECWQHYKCFESYCIPTRKVCDGVIDCPVGDDEASCVGYNCPGHLRCSGLTFCVPPHELCDGVSHCPQHEDEKYCQVCPQGCLCKGTSIYCDGVQSLDIIGHLWEPSALYLYNSYLIFEELYSVQLINMQFVRLLSLQGGRFDNVKLYTSFLSVKVLYLNYQGISVLGQSYINGPNMILVNLSHNSIHTIHRNAFDLMQNIKILSLISNYLQNLESSFCTWLKNLTHLHLSDNPLVSVASDVFLDTLRLVMIRSDWYMVCCVAVQVEDCHPQNQFISSCSNLVSSFAQRTITIAQGIIIVLGNIGSIFMQVAFQCNPAEKYLMVSLAVADFMMGIYLLAISYIDMRYINVFYQIVSEWTSSYTCVIFGLINFVSCEMSLMILSILSVARLIGVNKVNGIISLKSRIHIACFSTWMVIITVALMNITYVFTQHIKVRNSLCIILGTSDQRYITYFEQIFQNFIIICNTVLLMVIAVCMGCIFFVKKSLNTLMKIGARINKLHSNHNAKLRKVAFKLALLLLCNVLTWLPFMIVSILLQAGVNVHENVQQWVVVLGLPLSASTDPILYNLANLKTYLHRAKQSRKK